MAISDYEELKISSFINVTSFGWQPPTISVDFGGGYGAGAIVAPYGLRRWALSSDALPDADYTIDYTVSSVNYTSPRFTYFLEFFERQLLLGNKPFVILDPRTQKKFLVAFPDAVVKSGLDFTQITANVLSGGTSLVERRASDLTFNADGSIALDYTRPSGTLSVSQNDGMYKGTVTITATVSDNVAIARVEFYIDYELLSIDSSSAYTAVWDTKKHKNGNRKVMARVYDTSGNLTTIVAVINVLNETVRPLLAITYPVAGQTVAGTLAITATASDNVAVDRVEFYYFDGTGFALISIDSDAPYSAVLNTFSLPNGTLILSATAFDTSGNPSIAAFVTVTLDNEPDTIAPTVPEGLSISGTLRTEMLITWNPSSDEEAFGASSDDDYLLV